MGQSLDPEKPIGGPRFALVRYDFATYLAYFIPELHVCIYIYTVIVRHLFNIVYRGYYTAAQRYEFYFRVVRTIFYERAQRVSKILFLTRENKIHIFKPPCNFLFIIWTINIRDGD